MSVAALLRRYREIRDFSMTPEPRGGAAGGPRAGERPVFVVQEHHASHLHYDFRVEAEGVLKSWAVPKGPPMDTGTKRLAVQTEDHPIEYAKFEGDIPEGQYGGGHMTIWDHGTYDNLLDVEVPEAIEAGHVKIRLDGGKLQGAFSLRRMSGEDRQWLLVKLKDEGASRGRG